MVAVLEQVVGDGGGCGEGEAVEGEGVGGCGGHWGSAGGSVGNVCIICAQSVVMCLYTL